MPRAPKLTIGRRPWAHVADRGAESVAELVFDAHTESGYGVPERLTAAFEQALGIDELGALEARFRASLENEPRLTHGEDRDRQWDQRMLLRDLEAEARDYGRTLTAVRSEIAVRRMAQLKNHHIAGSRPYRSQHLAIWKRFGYKSGVASTGDGRLNSDPCVGHSKGIFECQDRRNRAQQTRRKRALRSCVYLMGRLQTPVSLQFERRQALCLLKNFHRYRFCAWRS